MPNEASLAEIETAELILDVDDGRVPTDTFKLPTYLRTLVVTRLADLRTKDAATLITEGGRAGAQINVRTALDTLNVLLHDGYNFIKGIGSYAITAADRAAVFTAYGWVSGELGEFTDARIESLARQAADATPGIANAAHRYPTALLDLIAAQLVIVNQHQTAATGGTAQTATDLRDKALKLLETANDRVRFHYCSASDDKDQTPELAKIGKQPRRDKGAASGPVPGAPGAATFDAAAKTLSVPAMPEGATTLRAYRKAAGGEPELAGTSTGTTVSVVGSGPLTVGVTYELWVAGHNAQGDGPESNHVSHTAV
ncbi:MAG: hypothetical protein RL514_4700 [Verrucomicrobiota bacterium]